jgi:hypothetical protein
MSRQGQLAAEPRRPPSGPAPIDQRGDQLFGRALDAGRPSARARLDSSRNAANTMLTAVKLLLNDSYNILIILDRARRARRKPTVLFEVLCEVMGRLDRACHNFVTVFRCGRVARGICPRKDD